MLTTCTDLRVRAGSQRWLRLRNTGIGASEIAMVLGIAPPSWGSPVALYYRKQGKLPDVPDNARMEWGRLLEAAILERFLKCHPEFRGGTHLTGRLYRSNVREWQLATPDAVVFDNRRGFAYDKHTSRTPHGHPVVVEIKTGSSKEEWGEPGSDEVPVYYRAQVMQSMDVVGADEAWMPVLFNGRDYREYRITRDARDIDILRARGAAFWRQVQSGNPPDVDGLEATTKAMRQVFGVDPEVSVQVRGDLVVHIARVKRLEKRTKALRERMENELRAAMGDAGVAMVGPLVAARRSRWEQGVVDLEALREDHPELIEKYTRKEPRQRLTLYPKDLA